MLTVEVIGKSDQKRGDIEPAVTEKAQELGRALGILSHGHLIIFTGGGSGYPFEVAMAARRARASVYAFPPVTDLAAADNLIKNSAGFLGAKDLQKFSGVVFIADEQNANAPSEETQIGWNRKRSEDMNDVVKGSGGTVLVVGGGAGTQREVVDALKKGIPVGVLLGSGGLTEELHERRKLDELLVAAGLDANAHNLIYFGHEPAELAQLAIQRAGRK